MTDKKCQPETGGSEASNDVAALQSAQARHSQSHSGLPAMAPRFRSIRADYPTTERLLSRLDGVRASGGRGWIAKCPAHGDKHASLSIGEASDGKVLVHCFAGCSALEVVQACGLTLADLFPERLRPSTPEERRVAQQQAKEARWMAATRTLNEEAAVSLIAAKLVGQGKTLSSEDLDRLNLAYSRIDEARAVLRGL